MKVGITVPNKLSDIRLSQYQKFIKTTDGSEDERYIRRQMVGIFCNISNELVGKISKKEFNEIVEIIAKALQEEPKLVIKTEYEGKKYGFIPKMEDITVDEQGDLDMFLKDWKDYDKAMGVLYRPIISESRGKYLIEDYKGDGKGLDVTLDVVFGAVGFFLNIQKDLLNYTLNFIQEEGMRSKMILEHLEKNGDGIRNITLWQKEILGDLKRSES